MSAKTSKNKFLIAKGMKNLILSKRKCSKWNFLSLKVSISSVCYSTYKLVIDLPLEIPCSTLVSAKHINIYQLYFNRVLRNRHEPTTINTRIHRFRVYIFLTFCVSLSIIPGFRYYLHCVRNCYDAGWCYN